MNLGVIPIKSISWIVCPMMLKRFQIYWSTFCFSHDLLIEHIQYLWTDVPVLQHIKIKINFNKSEIIYRPLHILDNGFWNIQNIWKSIHQSKQQKYLYRSIEYKIYILPTLKSVSINQLVVRWYKLVLYWDKNN